MRSPPFWKIPRSHFRLAAFMMAEVSAELRAVEVQQGQEGEEEQPQLSAQEERRVKIQRCLQSLAHATYCREINCQHLTCANVKRVFKHTKTCQQKTRGGCRICCGLIHLCCYHARRCLERECVLPYCRHIKLKLRQQQRRRRQRVQALHQAMAA